MDALFLLMYKTALTVNKVYQLFTNQEKK